MRPCLIYLVPLYHLLACTSSISARTSPEVTELAKNEFERDERPSSSRVFDLASVLSDLRVAQTAKFYGSTSLEITTTTSTSTEIVTTTTTATNAEFPLTPGTSIDVPTGTPLISDVPPDYSTSHAESDSTTAVPSQEPYQSTGSPTTPESLPVPPPTGITDSSGAPFTEATPASGNAGNGGNNGLMTSYTGWLPITSYSPNMDFQSISDMMSQSLAGQTIDLFTASTIDYSMDPMAMFQTSSDVTLPTQSIPLAGTNIDIHDRPTPGSDSNPMNSGESSDSQPVGSVDSDAMTNGNLVNDSLEKLKTTKYVFMTVPIDSLAVPQQTKYATLTQIETQIQTQTEISTHFATRIRTSTLLSTRTVHHTARPEPEPEAVEEPAVHVKPVKTGRPHRKPTRPYAPDGSDSLNMSDAAILQFNKALKAPCFQKCATSSCPLQEEFYLTCVCTQYTKRILSCAQDQCDGASYRKGVPKLVKACGNLFVDMDDDDDE